MIKLIKLLLGICDHKYKIIDEKIINYFMDGDDRPY
jgi:hypothetical protein